MSKKETIIGVKELRTNLQKYITRIAQGETFTVVKRSKPVFSITPVKEKRQEQWETVIDFTKIKKGGVSIDDILSRL